MKPRCSAIQNVEKTKAIQCSIQAGFRFFLTKKPIRHARSARSFSHSSFSSSSSNFIRHSSFTLVLLSCCPLVMVIRLSQKFLSPLRQPENYECNHHNFRHRKQHHDLNTFSIVKTHFNSSTKFFLEKEWRSRTTPSGNH